MRQDTPTAVPTPSWPSAPTMIRIFFMSLEATITQEDVYHSNLARIATATTANRPARATA